MKESGSLNSRNIDKKAATPRYVVVGNAPSSGSTLLGDLLDSTPLTVCGPELGVWCNPYLYQSPGRHFFDGFFRRHPSSSLYQPFNSMNRSRLHHYALDSGEFRAAFGAINDSKAFPLEFGGRFAAFRGRASAIWCEKTPENIQYARRFLDSFSDGYFVHLVRNPLYVADSLFRRGYSMGVSVFSWLFEVSNLHDLTHDRLITLRYEDLVDQPFETIGQLVGKVTGRRVTPDEVERAYEANEYRQAVSKKQVKGWRIRRHGMVIDGNRHQVNDVVRAAFSAAADYRISDYWSKAYGLPALSFREALRYFGYEIPARQRSDIFGHSVHKAFTLSDRMRFLKKHWFFSQARKSGFSKSMTWPVALSDSSVRDHGSQARSIRNPDKRLKL